eukprot:5301930-Amphidinium_carterae.1
MVKVAIETRIITNTSILPHIKRGCIAIEKQSNQLSSNFHPPTRKLDILSGCRMTAFIVAVHRMLLLAVCEKTVRLAIASGRALLPVTRDKHG